MRAGSMPPMSSMTMSAPRMRVSASVVSSSRGRSTSRGASMSRTAMPTSSSVAPARSASSSPCSQQQRGDLGADGAGAEERDSQAAVVGHAFPSSEVGVTPASRASRSSIVSPRTMTRASAPAHGDDGRAGDVVVVARRATSSRRRSRARRAGRRERRRPAGTRRRRRCRRTRSACRRRARGRARRRSRARRCRAE